LAHVFPEFDLGRLSNSDKAAKTGTLSNRQLAATDIARGGELVEIDLYCEIQDA